MKRRTVVAAAAIAAVAPKAFAQGPTEKVRKLNLYTWPQAALPQAYQASQLIASSASTSTSSRCSARRRPR